VPEAERVARLLTQAWSEATGLAAEPRAAAERAQPGTGGRAGNGQPALAGH
jgi:hypothetical protein